MKKYICLLVLILLWGCNDKPTTPDNLSSETAYGSSVIKIAGLPRDSLSAGKVIYKFSLTITGANMEPINISRSIDETGTVITVERIPAGRSRIFTGRLYGANGASYEGKAYADIFGGKVTNVRLILRRTGAAQVEVVIEDMRDPDKFEGCFDVEGKISGIDISDLTLEIPASPNNEFSGYFKKDDERIGKFRGTAIKGKTEAEIYITLKLDTNRTLDVAASFEGHVSPDYIKGEVFIGDQHAGIMYGKRINCEIIPDKFEGCYDVGGDINGVDLSNLTLEINSQKDEFGGYFMMGVKDIGKLWGTVINGKIKAELAIPLPFHKFSSTIEVIEARYEGYVTQDYKSFKGEIFSYDDPHKRIGYMYGNRINCKVESY